MHFGFDNSKNTKWRNGKFTSQMSTRQACHFEFCSIFLTIFWFYLFSSLLFRAPTFATWQTGQSHLCASLSFQSWITSVYSPCFLSMAPVLFSWYICSFVSVFFYPLCSHVHRSVFFPSLSRPHVFSSHGPVSSLSISVCMNVCYFLFYCDSLPSLVYYFQFCSDGSKSLKSV